MSQPNPSEHEILKSVLEPLLDDFQYWFSRSQTLLKTERLSFLSPEEQINLLQRVQQTQQEVSTAQMLFKATEGKVGIEASMLLPWHKLVAECWQLSLRWRSQKQGQG